MKIVTKKEEWNVRVCASLGSQARGWMFRRDLPEDGLIFTLKKKQTMSLHTWFCFRSLDILYVNEKRKVVKKYANVRPFTFFIPGVPATLILEIKNRTLIKEGDKITIVKEKRR